MYTGSYDVEKTIAFELKRDGSYVRKHCVENGHSLNCEPGGNDVIVYSNQGLLFGK